jgi:hypothetical protein
MTPGTGERGTADKKRARQTQPAGQWLSVAKSDGAEPTATGAAGGGSVSQPDAG